MADFKIRRGKSTTLFVSPGVVNPRLVIEEGCWYLCTDTAELFVGLVDDAGTPVLKRINGEVPEQEPDIGGSSTTQLESMVKDLEDRLVLLEDVELFQKIESEADLPTNFDSEDFNPNITYYRPLADGRVSTFIYDRDAQSYMCTNSVDELVVRAMVTEAIDFLLEDRLAAILPEAVKSTIETCILYGGDATPDE